jgi:hypothetical protein
LNSSLNALLKFSLLRKGTDAAIGLKEEKLLFSGLSTALLLGREKDWMDDQVPTTKGFVSRLCPRVTVIAGAWNSRPSGTFWPAWAAMPIRGILFEHQGCVDSATASCCLEATGNSNQ